MCAICSSLKLCDAVTLNIGHAVESRPCDKDEEERGNEQDKNDKEAQ